MAIFFFFLSSKNIYLPALGCAHGSYRSGWDSLTWYPEIDSYGMKFVYWSSTKDLNENQVYVFCPPRISSLSLNATERTKERLLERQRLLFSPSTPIDEKMKLFMRTKYVGETHYEAYAVRPVADKKWKGKLYK